MDSSTRTRLDHHLISAQAIVYRSIAGGLLEVMRHWVRGYSGLETQIFNIFLPLNPAGLSDDTLADTAAFFDSRNVLYAVELIHDRLPEGADYLNRCHYQSLPPQLAMCLEGQARPIQRNPEVTIEAVSTVPSLTAFYTLQHAIFDFPLRDMIKFFPVARLKDERIHHYLAFMDEQPVGAGTLICADRVATVRDICTLDQFRQRGVATALTHHMLSEAEARGCDLAMLYATAQAYTLFNKLGFEIYTQRQWFLPPGIDYED